MRLLKRYSGKQAYDKSNSEIEVTMIYIREFEFYREEGYVAACPCDMEGATFGEDIEDAAVSAADWLYETVLDNLAHGRKTPGGKLDHKPKHNGRIIAIAVNADLSHANAVTAAEAAKLLGVSTARVAQMCENGKLTSWKQGSHRMIMCSSIEARLAENPKPGRPQKVAIV